MLLHIFHFQIMCWVVQRKRMYHILHAHPLVTIVERKDTFVLIARSCKVYQRPNNGERIFLHPKQFQFGLENPICLRSILTLCWKIKLHKCGWLHIKSPDQRCSASTPSAATRIHWGGVTASRLTEATWWYLFVNYGQLQGEKNEARESFTSQGNSRSEKFKQGPYKIYSADFSFFFV